MRGVGVHITEEAVVSGWTVDAAELWWFRSCSPKCGLSQQMGMMGLDQCREDPFLPYTCFPLSSPPTLLPGQDCDCALQDNVRGCVAAALAASSPALGRLLEWCRQPPPQLGATAGLQALQVWEEGKGSGGLGYKHWGTGLRGVGKHALQAGGADGTWELRIQGFI